MIPKTYNAGIYVRLSKEDAMEGESVSIENQKLLLTRHVREQGWNEAGQYVDDGYTGTHFERPGFKQMMEDVKNGKINLVIVKDLSRLGRNHVHIGQLTDYILPSFGCRFIALNNNVDSLNSDSMDMMPFINFFNEFYSKDISKKIRSAKKTSALEGKYQAMCPPYGYIKSADNKHQLVIDTNVIENVRRIYKLRCEGYSQRRIAFMLNEEGVEAPMKYLYDQRIITYEPKGRGLWSDITVHKILSSEVYIGHLIQGTCTSVSYKNRKKVSKPEEEWIKVENTHEAAIPIEMWNVVRDLEKNNFHPRAKKDGETDLFSGLLKCMDCGYSMRTSTQTNARKTSGVTAYVCNSYGSVGMCSSHRIAKKQLKIIVMESIKNHAKAALLNEDKVVASVMKKQKRMTSTQQEHDKAEVKKLTQRLSELETVMQNLYEDKVKGALSDKRFAAFMQTYEAEQAEKEIKFADIQKRIDTQKKDSLDINEWIKMIRQYASIEELDRRMLLELVDKIEIGDPKIVDGEKKQLITIHYKLVGAV